MRGQRRRPGDPRDAEVHQLRAPADSADLAHDHVLGLDVAVNDTAVMGVDERLAEVGDDLGDVAVAEIPGGLELGEGLARHQLADEDGAPLVFAKLVKGDDCRVVQPCGRLRLTHDPIGVAQAQLLDRDLALQTLVERPIDRSHAARTDALEEAETLHHEMLTHDPHRSPGRFLLLPSAPGFILGPRRTASEAQSWLSSTTTS